MSTVPAPCPRGGRVGVASRAFLRSLPRSTSGHLRLYIQDTFLRSVSDFFFFSRSGERFRSLRVTIVPAGVACAGQGLACARSRRVAAAHAGGGN